MQNEQLNDIQVKKKEKFSYSRLEVFEQCPYKYDLVYRKKHFIHDDSVATDFGTLIHYIEETMARKIIAYEKLDYAQLIDFLYTANIHEKNETILGVNILREKYKTTWYEKDKSGRTYEDKVLDYVGTGIYRLRDFLINHPTYEIVGIEQPFKLEYGNVVFSGFIDRVFKDTETGLLHIEDIKTWNVEAKHDHLTTPLQFVIYCLAAEQLYNVDLANMLCTYELPLCNKKQIAGTKGFIKRGIKKIDSLLDSIESGCMTPSPSPLCHWCVFSKTFINGQPEEAKKLCPYYSLYTKTNNNYTGVANVWLGENEHEAILESFKRSFDIIEAGNKIQVQIPPRKEKFIPQERRFILRRD